VFLNSYETPQRLFLGIDRRAGRTRRAQKKRNESKKPSRHEAAPGEAARHLAGAGAAPGRDHRTLVLG
jgi:hypothetical protein